MFYVNIIQSSSSGRWYYGFTTELIGRLDAHNNGLNRSTIAGRPWHYIFQRPFDKETDARLFENYLKRTRNKQYIRLVFAQHRFESCCRPDSARRSCLSLGGLFFYYGLSSLKDCIGLRRACPYYGFTSSLKSLNFHEASSLEAAAYPRISQLHHCRG